MKFELRRDEIRIIPETEQDKAYIEDTLGLTMEFDSVRLERHNAMGLSAIAYLRASRRG